MVPPGPGGAGRVHMKLMVVPAAAGPGYGGRKGALSWSRVLGGLGCVAACNSSTSATLCCLAVTGTLQHSEQHGGGELQLALRPGITAASGPGCGRSAREWRC